MTTTLAWIRNLPEVGSAVRRMADEEERLAVEIARARATVAALESDAEALRARAECVVAADWSAEDIATARASEPVGVRGIVLGMARRAVIVPAGR